MTNNNNNNSDKIYVIVGIVIFLCFMSIGAALLIRNITKSDTSKKSPSPSSAQPSPSSAQPSPSSAQPASLPPASLPPASLPPPPPPPYTVKAKTEFTSSKMSNKYVNKSTGELGNFTNSYWRDASKPFSEHMEDCKAKCNQFDNCKAIEFVPGENYCSMTNADGNNSNITNSDNRVEIHIKP